jgi:hypothetical protein
MIILKCVDEYGKAEELFALAQDGGRPIAGFVENLDRSKAGTLLFDIRLGIRILR